MTLQKYNVCAIFRGKIKFQFIVLQVMKLWINVLGTLTEKFLISFKPIENQGDLKLFVAILF